MLPWILRSVRHNYIKSLQIKTSINFICNINIGPIICSENWLTEIFVKIQINLLWSQGLSRITLSSLPPSELSAALIVPLSCSIGVLHNKEARKINYSLFFVIKILKIYGVYICLNNSSAVVKRRIRNWNKEFNSLFHWFVFQSIT